MSDSEFDDDDKSKCVDEMLAEFIQSIELNSCSESWAFELEARVGAAARRELRMSEASLLVSRWVLRMWASNDESRLSISQTRQALLESDGYEMILTKARKALTHLGPSLRATSHSFDQETILAMWAMHFVSSLLLHFSRRRDLSFLAIWSLICLVDGLSSSPDSGLELEIRSECVKLVLRCSSSSRHSRMRQTQCHLKGLLEFLS